MYAGGAYIQIGTYAVTCHTRLILTLLENIWLS